MIYHNINTQGKLSITGSGDWTVTGTGSVTSNVIEITGSGTTVNITLQNVKITSSTTRAMFIYGSNIICNLSLNGANTLQGYGPGLFLLYGNTLNVYSVNNSLSDTLTAIGANWNTGIGTGWANSSGTGTINVYGGYVNAYTLGQAGSAGIGGCYQAPQGSPFHLYGGKVYAKGGGSGAGLGGHYAGNTVVLHAGILQATSGAVSTGGSPIGGGYGYADGTLTLEGTPIVMKINGSTYTDVNTWKTQAQLQGNNKTAYIELVPSNTSPFATIATPENDISVLEYKPITLVGAALDEQDGDISSLGVWSSSLDGNIGQGASITISTLSVGTHTITYTVTDSGNLSDSDSVIVTVVPVKVMAIGGKVCVVDNKLIGG